MKQSAVSIIVVNFDGLEHLATLFASLHSLRYPQKIIEIVFVDNESDDGSVGWAKEKYPHVRVVENEREWMVPLKEELGVDYMLDAGHKIEYTLEGLFKELKEAGLEPESWEIRWGEIWCVAVPEDGETP